MIIEASVKRLLGEFDHTVSFGPDSEFVIAYGLNGVGKTKFLEIINATINPDYSKLAFATFSSLQLVSDSGAVLTVDRSESEDDRGRVAQLRFTVGQGSRGRASWNHEVVLTADDEFVRWLSRNTNWAPTDDPYIWEDRSDGDIADIEDLRSIFGHQFPKRRASRPSSDRPEELTDFQTRNRTYLIETQRLGMMVPRRSRYGTRGESTPKWTVEGYSNDIRNRLQRALAENSLRSQRLDRTFPARILNFDADQEVISVEELREGFQQLDALRERLSDIGLTDNENALPLPEQDIEDFQISVLTTYLKDNREKLSSFDDLREKIDLLEGLVNERFLRKKIDVSVERGLAVLATSDGSPIPARGLSSGEQHELVLIYNLLFRVEPGTLVLIDEPEISLHVSWQKKFLDDILRIADTSKLRFVIATHSPTIIGKWWSRTVQLGPTEDEDA